MSNGELTSLVAEAASGDSAAFEKLFNVNWNMAYYHCFKYLRNKAEAEEAAQDAFFTLFRNIDKLKDIRLFKAYFLRILTNTCHNRAKSRMFKNNSMTFSVDSVAETLSEERMDFLPGVALNQQELRVEIIQCIEGLPKKQREVMLLHFLQELSQSEIAAVLDVKPSVVANRLFHAKAALKQKFEKLGSKSGVYAAVLPVTVITQALTEEMTMVATPQILSRAWEGLQVQVNTYGTGELPNNYGSSNAISTALVAAACTAVICFVVLSVNYYNARQPVGPYIHPSTIVTQSETCNIVEELRAITTADEFNSFVVRHSFNLEQVVTWQTHEGEIRYHFYQRTFEDMIIFTGIRSDMNAVAIVYQIVPPGTSSPADVSVWIDKMKII